MVTEVQVDKGKQNFSTHAYVMYMHTIFGYVNTPPQIMHSPSGTAKCLAFSASKVFVSVSAIMSSVGQ